MREDIRAVEQAWANPVKRQSLPVPNPYARTNLVHTGQGRQTIMTKLDRIRLDSVSFDRQPLSEVVRSLADESINVIVVEDCCAAGSDELHRRELEIINMIYCHVLSSAELRQIMKL